MVYGCDICQDVCPWNRGVEKRRRDEPALGEPSVSLADWLQADGPSLVDRYRPALRPAQRPALPAPERARRARQRRRRAGDAALAEPFAAGDDELLREHAEWALARIAEREVSG